MNKPEMNESAVDAFEEIAKDMLETAAKTGTLAELSATLAMAWCSSCLPLGRDGFEIVWRTLPEIMNQIIADAREQAAGHNADAMIAKVMAKAKASQQPQQPL